MRLLSATALALLTALLLPTISLAEPASSKENDPIKPCTARSSSTGSFFDLNPINLHPPSSDNGSKSKKKHKDERKESWKARGYDYHANFTLNFCGPVIEDVRDVVDLERSQWRNVSAYYKKDDNIYSIGQSGMDLVVRGRKLVLSYTGGSYCTTSRHRDDDDNDRHSRQWPSGARRKNTIISLLCEKDPMAAKATVSFVGTDPDECSYFFEARSPSACPAVNVQKQSLGPSGVFGVIALIAVLVYLVGGIFYQRIVMHQRGWRQLPNYGLWSGIFGFARDMLIIITSTVSRCLPRGLTSFGARKGGYSRLNSGGMNGGGFNGVGAGRGSRDVSRSLPEDENRLIDQLDEEWED